MKPLKNFLSSVALVMAFSVAFSKKGNEKIVTSSSLEPIIITYNLNNCSLVKCSLDGFGPSCDDYYNNSLRDSGIEFCFGDAPDGYYVED